MATESDLDAAVAAARKAFDGGQWSSNAKRRARVMSNAVAKIRAEIDALSPLLSREVGKPLSEARVEVLSMMNTFEAYAGMADNIRGRAVSNATPEALGVVLKEPVGVVALIIPWNWPLSLLSWKLGAALAAGCTTVIKPSIYTSRDDVRGGAHLPGGGRSGRRHQRHQRQVQRDRREAGDASRASTR